MSEVTAYEQAIVYGSESCPFCVKAKKFLAEKGIPTEFRDVTIEDSGNREWVEYYWKQQGVSRATIPVVILDGFPVGGYSELEQSFA